MCRFFYIYVGKQHQFFQIVGSFFLKPMNTDIFEVGKKQLSIQITNCSISFVYSSGQSWSFQSQIRWTERRHRLVRNPKSGLTGIETRSVNIVRFVTKKYDFLFNKTINHFHKRRNLQSVVCTCLNQDSILEVRKHHLQKWFFHFERKKLMF